MSRLNFGNTWWGEKWLDALTHIDYENRLPRGKSYARGGYVSDIQINGNQVKAKVQGRRPRPYSVSIHVLAFNQKQQDKIVKIILDNKLLLSQLMTRQLPEGLYDELEKQRVKLFPKNWNDLDANCSCPDWAVPCKHIAAVIYLIANEIDKNPFLVFELHNFDIFKALEKFGFSKQQTANSYMTCLEDIIKLQPSPKEDFILDIKKIDQLDFSTIPYLQEQILALLDDNPLFYPQGNFKQSLQKIYKQLTKEISWTGEDKDEEKTWERDTEEYTQIKAILNVDLQIQDFRLATTDGKFNIDASHKQDKLINFLASIPLAKITYHSDQLIALSFIYRFVLRLIEQGAFIPQLIQLNKNTYRLIWTPALIDQHIESIFKVLKDIIPPNLMGIQQSNRKKKSPIVYPAPVNQLKLLISLFLEYFIDLASVQLGNLGRDPVLDLFFHGKVFKADSFETQEIPQTINLWLSKFFIKHKDYVPLLKVDARQNDFTVETLVENTQKQIVQPVPLNKVLTDKNFAAQRAEVMRDLTLLSTQFPQIKQTIQSEGKECLRFNSQEFVQVFFKALPAIKLLGIQILLPKQLQAIIKPKISLLMKKKDTPGHVKSYLSLDQMLEFDWQVALGDKFVSPQELVKLWQESQGIVKFKDSYIYIDDVEIKKMLDKMSQAPKLSAFDLLKTALAEEYDYAPLNITPEVANLIKSLLTIREIPIPKKLKASLRAYQERGYWWLYKNAQIGFGSLIADDMGLGKTLQVITVCLKLKEEGVFKKQPGLIIVPTTLLTNWQKEIAKFAPYLKTHVYHGNLRNFGQHKSDLIITTYGLIRRDQQKFNQLEWPLITIDEAQNIKNTTTAQTKAVKSLKSPIKIAMTGTPVENRLSEYYSITDFLNRGYLGSLKKFTGDYARQIELYRDQHTLEKFKKITAPFILRRVKTDKTIIKDLPQKNEIDQFCNLTKEQTALYKSVVDDMMKKVEKSEGIERKGLVFKLMTALKQICNHPAQFLKKASTDPGISGKTALLLEVLQTIYDNDEKVLLFTQYTQMGKLLINILEEQFKSEILFLHGGVARKKRDELIERFQHERQLNVLILSLKAGGTGLNLTAASNVIHFDLWWNPAVEAQATDRAYRIGQTKNVMVHRLICQDTFEEKINKMIQDKKELADLTVTKGEKWIGELSNQELKNLFKI